jgi:hypothetical protein
MQGIGFNLNRFRAGRDFQRDVNPQSVIGIDRDVLFLEGGKPGGGGLKRVVPYGQGQEVVLPVRVRGCRKL